jgi:hypothetical protein
MPQETKSMPSAAVQQENLEGWIPALATDDDIRAALEKAFDYRGDITLTLKDGSKIEGYVFDRRTTTTLADCVVRLFPKDRDDKLSIPYANIARLEFTGRDTAAGKSLKIPGQEVEGRIRVPPPRTTGIINPSSPRRNVAQRSCRILSRASSTHSFQPILTTCAPPSTPRSVPPPTAHPKSSFALRASRSSASPPSSTPP